METTILIVIILVLFFFLLEKNRLLLKIISSTLKVFAWLAILALLYFLMTGQKINSNLEFPELDPMEHIPLEDISSDSRMFIARITPLQTANNPESRSL